jgi:hypothetical protein
MRWERSGASILAVVAAAFGVYGCGGNELSEQQLAEISDLSGQASALCKRDAPLVGSETAPALRMVRRLMELVGQAPDQRWVLDSDDPDTGTTTPAGQLQYVGEIFGTAPERRDPICSPYLAGRIDQFRSDAK